MKNSFLKYLLVFLILNFGALGLGTLLMNNGPTSEWYINLNKAPWTPPGWVFGVAWTSIMICFSIFLAKLFEKDYSFRFKVLFAIQFILNVSWNYVFFNQYQTLTGLVFITFLTSIVFYYFFEIGKKVDNYRYLILPYLLWLCIATSLNLYIVIHN